jgi:hypothetical protein
LERKVSEEGDLKEENRNENRECYLVTEKALLDGK